MYGFTKRRTFYNRGTFLLQSIRIKDCVAVKSQLLKSILNAMGIE